MIWLPVWNKIFIVVQVEILIQFMESILLENLFHLCLIWECVFEFFWRIVFADLRRAHLWSLTHLTDPQEFSQFLFSVEAFSGDDICLMSLHCFCKLAAIALNSAGSTLASDTDEGIVWLLRRVSEFSLLSLVFCFSVIM